MSGRKCLVFLCKEPCGTKLKRDYTYIGIMELKNDLYYYILLDNNFILYCIDNIYIIDKVKEED